MVLCFCLFFYGVLGFIIHGFMELLLSRVFYFRFFFVVNPKGPGAGELSIVNCRRRKEELSLTVGLNEGWFFDLGCLNVLD
jgi:hypothetical protein